MNLQKVRVFLRLTQKELAALMGVNQCHISMMELGKRNITEKFKEKMHQLIIRTRGKEARLEKMAKTGRLNSKWDKIK